jgi:hypothetical protein
MIIEGSTTAVAEFVDQMLEATRDAGGRSRHLIVDGAQVVANAAALRQTHREYFEFSDRARRLLREHGTIPGEEGFFRSFVHNGKTFAGNLDWKPVDLSPERALSLQAAAGQMALRVAVKEITTAVERVEGKVDKLVNLVEAERLGAVVADQATLQPLVDRVRACGDLSRTDWATVASLGPLIARDIESLRAYIVRQLKDVKKSPLVRRRASVAEELTDRLLRESIALLVVAENNYALWQELRLAHSVNHEPAATAAVAADIQQQLAALTQADQALVDLLQGIADQVSSSTGYEGIAPLQKRRLIKHVAQLDDMSGWFCDQRNLDALPAERPELAGLPESLLRIRYAMAGAARDRTRAIVQSPSRIRNRREIARTMDEPAEISTPADGGVRQDGV